MPLTSQPYIPFYVQDWLSNNKLKFVSLAAHGLLINIMCVLHKEDNYGQLILKEKYKYSNDLIDNFATMLSQLLPFSKDNIYNALVELIEEKLLYIENNVLINKRMVKDAELSEQRKISGAKGGTIRSKMLKKSNTKTNSQAKEEAKSQANIQPKSENENEIEIESVIENEFVIENESVVESENTKKEKQSLQTKYFEELFHQMLPAEYLDIWKTYIDYQAENNIKFTQTYAKSQLKMFKECLENGVSPSELLEAFFQTNHKGLYFISKKLIKDKHANMNGTNRLNRNIFKEIGKRKPSEFGISDDDDYNYEKFST